MCIDKKYRLPLLLFNGVFVALYVLLVFNNRYSSDDFWLVYIAKQKGIVGGAMFMYQSWSALPPELMVLNLFVTLLHEKVALVAYGFFVLLLLVAVIKKYLQRIAAINTVVSSEFDQYQYAIAFSALFFFSCFSVGETWFWLCSSMGYLLPIVVALWTLYFILFSSLNKFLRYLLIILCWIFVLGSAESFSVTCLLLILLYLFYKLIKDRKAVLNDRVVKELCVLALVSFIALVYIYYSPGVEKRKLVLPESSILKAIQANIIATGILFLRKLPSVLPYALTMSLPFVVLGSLLRENNWFTWERMVFITIGVFALSSFLLFPMCYVLSEIAPDRALTFHGLLFASLVAVWALFIGNKLRNLKVIRFVWVLPLVSSFALCLTINNQQQITKIYNEKLNERQEIVALFTKEGTTGIVSLPNLPSSGMLHSAELGSDTADYRNRFYKLYYDLKFGVVVKE